MRLTILITSLIALNLSACSDADISNKNSSSQTDTARSDATEVTWEDLMPVGEEELLTQMYSEYYEQLEARMMANAKSLNEAGESRETDDSSSSANDGSSSTDDSSSPSFDLGSITEGSANDTMEQIGTYNVVDSLNGVTIRIPGYVVPLDFNAGSKHKEFLLVPYFGACLHTPPPPPNQILYVKADPPVEVANIYEPIWAEGKISTGEFNSELGNTAYELTLNKIEPYDY